MSILLDQHRRALTYWRATLIVATILSVVGNAAHAWFTVSEEHQVVAALLAVVPPVAFFATVEGIALLVGAGASGVVYKMAVAVTALIAAGAFVVSFATLRDFVRTWGALPAPWLAWLFPALLDLLMATATFVLVALGDKPAPRVRRAAQPRVGVVWKMRDFLIAREPSTTAPQVNTPARGARTQPAQPSKLDTAPCSPGPLSAPAPTERAPQAPRPATTAPDIAVSDAHRERACELLSAGVTQKDSESVARVLALAESGASVTRIERETRVHRDAVKKILAAAAQDHVPVLAAAV
ncbi:DUF2637 domain-containing protein [Mycobacteroides abscessus]|uniref:DUF2637 domain-containing protein n=1 Tax=Mycobacteroides abscessus TaxID=36809 RepID=UPI000C26446A|nr:DUF2637 domain-containing protein [Mycobacteroides abscessus]AWG55016.1 DUF2637 domain-containing protein [Mycobacteroides abscessus]MDQ8119598.1 DUF2637 domain-containing protein [Mycobacteroides abscessus subsp. massiliense]